MTSSVHSGRCSHRLTYRRRAGTYVFFLGSATLVSIIAISALTVMRIGLQRAEDSNHMALAQAQAQSAVEQGLLKIYNDSSWRTSVSHNAWSTAQSIGGGTMSWKIVDDVNGNFTTDRNARVRVHGKGVHGPAVWVLSVQVQPPPEVVPANKLTNGDLESGATSPWTNQGTGSFTLGSGSYSGTYCGRLGSRAAGSAAAQALSSLSSGTQLQLSAWVTIGVAPDTAWLGVRIISSSGTRFFVADQLTLSSTGWDKLEGTITPTWTGTLTSATFLIGTDGSGDFKFDEATLKYIPNFTGTIAESWKREAQ